MHLIPIKEHIEDNSDIPDHPVWNEIVQMTVDFYKSVGYTPPWIGYFVKLDDEIVATIGFKGKPVNSTVEIAYATFEEYRKRGIGTLVCGKLVELTKQTDPKIKITARTLPERNHSVRILEKNNFIYVREVQDPEDGLVWEWEHKP